MRIRALSSLVALGVTVSVTAYAMHAQSPPTRHAVHGRYSSIDVLQFLLFSTGRVVAEHPDLTQPRPGPIPPDSKARTVLETVSRCVDRLDAAAVPALTAAFNAADPQRLDSALQRFDAAGRHWMTAPQ